MNKPSLKHDWLQPANMLPISLALVTLGLLVSAGVELIMKTLFRLV